MAMRKAAAASVAALLAACAARGDVFNLGNPNLRNLDLVTVSDPGNAPGTPDLGQPIEFYDGRIPASVAYVYQMGKYDVTAAQYCQFLNAVAAQSDPFGLYNPDMSGGPGSGACGIVRTGSAGSYSYGTTGSGYATANNGNFPVGNVSWGDAARFCNWLTNGQLQGAAGAASTETGSYTLNGALDDANLMRVTRSANARYVIPTDQEWYKAAFYQGGSTNKGYWLYPTESNTAPSNVLSGTGTNNANYRIGASTLSDPVNLLTEVGAFADSPGPYGTFDMGGDSWQWTEGNVLPPYVVSSERITRGGYWGWTNVGSDLYYHLPPTVESTGLGFRIAEVPEPATMTLLALGGAAALRRRRCRASGTRRV